MMPVQAMEYPIRIIIGRFDVTPFPPTSYSEIEFDRHYLNKSSKLFHLHHVLLHKRGICQHYTFRPGISCIAFFFASVDALNHSVSY